jgi:hypothetical protein
MFRPGDRITRQEAAAILMRACDLPETEPEGDSIVDSASDSDEISSWARDSFYALASQDVMSGFPDGTLQPSRATTRAEFASMLMKIDQLGIWNDFSYPVKQLEVTAPGMGDVVLNPQVVEKNIYIFLPSPADLTSLEIGLPLTDGDGTDAPAEAGITLTGSLSTASGTVFDITELSEMAPEGWYELEVTVESGSTSFTSPVRIIKSAGVPAMFLTSNEGSGGRYYVESKKANSVKGSMIMIGTDGDEVYNGALSQIKSRGNSTFTYLKKPYQIKLDKKTDLLGNGEKVKTWVLLGNYAEPSMMRDKICKDIAHEMDLPGSPDCSWVDLWFDGEYRGCYLLSEKVQISKTGLDITDLESMYEDANPGYGIEVVTAETKNVYGDKVGYVEGITDPEDFSQGYLLEMSNCEADENSWFLTTRGWALNVKSPENLSEAAMIYISERWHEFEDAVYARDEEGNHTGINPNTGKAFYEYCDLDSLCCLFLIYYFSNNQDAYALSTYYYLEGDSFTAGPVWDGDQTFGIGWLGPVTYESELRMHYLIEAMDEIEAFRVRTKEIYETEFRAIAEKYAREMVPSYTSRLREAEAMNRVMWPVYFSASGLYFAHPEGTTYVDITHEMAQWMNHRLTFMDQKFSDWNSKKDQSLETQFPEYYGLDTFKGLEVYVWEETGGYMCGVLPGTNRNKTEEEIIGLTRNGASFGQMKEILSSYGIERDMVAIVLVSISDTSYEVLEQGLAGARELFWGD